MKTIFAIALALLLGACASQEQRLVETIEDAAAEPAEDGSLIKRALDRAIPVSEAHRPERACFLASAMIELLATKARTITPETSEEAIGIATSLQDAVEAVRNASPVWRNTDMAYVELAFIQAGVRIGRRKIISYLTLGPTPAAAIEGAKHAAIDVLIGRAAFQDVRNAMAGLESGELSEAEARQACNERISANRQLLRVVNGSRLIFAPS